jgi:hypothetical protein
MGREVDMNNIKCSIFAGWISDVLLNLEILNELKVALGKYLDKQGSFTIPSKVKESTYQVG